MSASPLLCMVQPWMIERFGRPVHRIALDAGSTCPNRDGTKGFGGCSYCDVEGSGTGALQTGLALTAQFEAGLERIVRRRGGRAVGAIAYFQSYSNTYVAIERLREVLGVLEPWIARADSPLVAVSIATRPDTLAEDALCLLARLNERLPVWLELGLETASDQVQRTIGRLHTLADFEDAVKRAHQVGLLTVAHAILGLPGDGRAGARRTAEALAESGVSGIKVHQLMVLRRTQMEKQWRRGELELLGVEQYIEWLADFVERLAPEQVLHRLTGEAPIGTLLAPEWKIDKHLVRDRLEAELARRGTRQGAQLNRA